MVDVQEEVKEKPVNFPPMLCIVLSRQMGYYCSSYLGNDLYFLNENVKLMMGYLKALKGEDWFEKNIKDWSVKKKRLALLNNKLQEVKTWYDVLEDKRFEKNDADLRTRKFFFRSAMKIPLIDEDLYDIFGFLLLNTNLKRQIIPSDSYKILEQSGYRTLHLEKKKTESAHKDEDSEMKEHD